MYLTGLIHRDRLFTTSVRWFGDAPVAEDGRTVTAIFLYEPLITGPAMRRFAVDVLCEFHGENLTYEPIAIKDLVRERVVESIPRMTARIRRLVDLFRERPEEFFPRTPVDAVIFRTRSGRLVGLSRQKRPRRIAEKAARRMADTLIELIRDEADLLAYERAQRQGVPATALLTSPQEMEREFLEAERVVAFKFRDRSLQIRPRDLKIDDVLGLKFIVSTEERDRMEAVISSHPLVSIVEREEHVGHYNAVNIQLDLTLPSVSECIELAGDLDWSFAEKRGVSAERAARDFAPYIETGARTARIEVILTTYEELVESEFGRSLHERRIIRVRDSAEYSGRIARNASYIIEYLLALAYSPVTEIDEVPVKLWGHYLPETLGCAVNQLHGVGEVGLMFHHYIQSWSDRRCARYENGSASRYSGAATPHRLI